LPWSASPVGLTFSSTVVVTVSSTFGSSAI
jgi:hypothetical protein